MQNIKIDLQIILVPNITNTMEEVLVIKLKNYFPDANSKNQLQKLEKNFEKRRKIKIKTQP